MRRMIDPQLMIKSQIVDDKWNIDLHEIVEKHGTVLYGGDVTTITLQFYNKEASDEGQNALSNDNGDYLGSVFMNGAITMSKWSNGLFYIQGMLVDNSNNSTFIPFLEIPSGSYEDGLMINSGYEFDIYVIRV